MPKTKTNVRDKSLKCVIKYAYQHRVTTSTVPFEAYLFMLPSTVFLENPDIKKVIEVQTLKKRVFPLHVDSEIVYFSLFCKYFGKKYHFVDGIHYRSKYLTSTFKLKSKFDQIVTLFNIFSNVSATCWCREKCFHYMYFIVSITCQ